MDVVALGSMEVRPGLFVGGGLGLEGARREGGQVEVVLGGGGLASQGRCCRRMSRVFGHEIFRWVMLVRLQPHQFEVEGGLLVGQRVKLCLVWLLVGDYVDHGEELGGVADVAPPCEGLLLVRGLWQVIQTGRRVFPLIDGGGQDVAL